MDNQKENLQSGIDSLYEKRQKFILIGLTGRTGSGCSTVAELLGQSFLDINPPIPQLSETLSNDERKYKILYEYSKINWHQFFLIQLSNVITSFVVEASLDEFTQLVFDELKDISNLSDEVKKNFIDAIKGDFENAKKNIPQYELDHNDKIVKSNAIWDYFHDTSYKLSGTIKKELEKIAGHDYTKIYQKIGDNIRSSGHIAKDEFQPENISSISERTNKIIKAIRNKCKEEKKPAFIVIDAFRNPYEAQFFSERYSAFYLFSINTPNEDREKRLSEKLNITPKQLKELDDKEYDKKPEGYKLFISQDIKKCIEISDIHIRNPQLNENDTSFLKKQLIWYISLVLHPGLVTPTPIERAMQLAYTAKLNSGCISRQVGAVVTNDQFAIKAVGWNSVPQGQVPCILRNINDLKNHHDKPAFSHYELNDKKFREFVFDTVNANKVAEKDFLKGRNFSYCFKDFHNHVKCEKNQVHTRSLHAEENAFLQITKDGGQSLQNGFLFTTASPCELCSKKAYQIGIKKIFYIDPYPGISQSHILNSGTNKPELELFSGAIGKSYYQLYQSVMPYKDEIEMLMYININRQDFKTISFENKELKQEIELLKAENEKLKNKYLCNK